MNKLLACEIGNYDAKFMTRENALKELIESKGGKNIDDGSVLNILNIVAPAKERRSLGGVKSLINLLDVTITTSEESACGHYFVGGLALKEGSQIFKPTREDEKSKNPTTLVIMLTTLAFALFDPKEPTKKEIVNLGTLLPTEEYFKDGYAVEFVNKLTGEHKVKFNDPAFQGGEITIKINNVELLPEGAAGQTATTFDWNGEAFDKDYVTKSVMNIDIGSIDTDISIMQEGEFISKGFFGIKGGTTEVLRSISNEIKEKHGYGLDTHRLDYHVRSKKPILMGTKSVPDTEIADMVDKHYAKNAWILSNKITEELQDRLIEKHQLNEVNLIGGGPEFFEKGFKKHFETGYMKIQVPKNARFKNVEGVLKSLIFKATETDEAEGEIFDQQTKS